MARWRVALHALDRTGPPMLALAFSKWLVDAYPADELAFVAFRGGELLDEFVRLGPTVVLLDPSEPWDHDAPDPHRIEVVTARAQRVGRVDATLLVSVAAGQVLPYVPESDAPVVAWSVEQGEDLHWIGGPLDLIGRVDVWAAGSDGTRRELLGYPNWAGGAVAVVPEFVSPPAPVAPSTVANCRTALGADPDTLLVVGMGIATWRKAPDLFVEVALAHVRAGRQAEFVWLGGERDPLFGRVRDDVERLGLANVRLVGSVVDVVPWCAAADVVLHPARLDAFPLVALHAAAVGTPVVGFEESGGLVEMFGDAFVGSSFPDVVALSDLVAGLEDPVSRSAAGRAQQERVQAHLADVAAPHLRSLLEASLDVSRSAG